MEIVKNDTNKIIGKACHIVCAKDPIKNQKIVPTKREISATKYHDRIIRHTITGNIMIIARSVPLVPDAIPASQNPINRQAIVINFS